MFSADGRHNKGTAVYHRDLTQFRNFNDMVLALRLHIQKNLGNDQWTLEENDVVTLLNKYECGEILQAIRNIKNGGLSSDLTSYYPPEIVELLMSQLERMPSERRRAA